MTDVTKNYEQIREMTERKIAERDSVTNRRQHTVVPRRHHLTTDQQVTARKRFEKLVENLPIEIKQKAGTLFFNPYRQKGIYFGCVQALYSLGANEWHLYHSVQTEMEKNMSKLLDKEGRSVWEKFAKKTERKNAVNTKDLLGRIQANLRMLQRLGGIHPYGYKLKQLNACIDIKREKTGVWTYRLNTQNNSPEDVVPLYDHSLYTFAVAVEPVSRDETVVVTVEETEVTVEN